MFDVQRVAPASLIGGPSRPDAYLYLVAGRGEADHLLRHGLTPDATEPPRLVERGGVAPLLSILEEDGTGVAGIVVLRLRRAMVSDLIEPDPDRPRTTGCFLLTGRPGGIG